MRGASMVLVACCAAFAVQADAPRRTLQGSTEPAADAPGWNGRMPDGLDPQALTGAGSRLGAAADGGRPGYGYGGRGYGYGFGFDAGPCGWPGGPILPGSSHSAGAVIGGSFRSTVRCADGSPGLPPGERAPYGWAKDDAPPYRRPYDDPWPR